MSRFTKSLFAILLLAVATATAQDIYALKTSKVHFYASTPLEDIEAENTKAVSFLNIKTGDVVIDVMMKDFHFKRSLMEEHFNENYMETEKYPKGVFKGKITNVASYNFNQETSFTVQVEGILTVHGVSKPRSIEVVIKNNKGLIEAETKFKIPLVDHNIERPKIVFQKIAEIVDVTATLTYDVFKK